MSLEDLLRDREFIMKMVWIGFLASLVFIAIGAYVIILELSG